ncbi:MAG TPA: hypothetical protein VHL79_09640 [Ramlibacter sp.]|jgi:hypothetical protein|nr:hypothetical protein [Ramlibacter sp.]
MRTVILGLLITLGAAGAFVWLFDIDWPTGREHHKYGFCKSVVARESPALSPEEVAQRCEHLQPVAERVE